MRPGQHKGPGPSGCIQLCGFQNAQAADSQRCLHLIPCLCEAVVRDDQRPFQDLPYRLQLAEGGIDDLRRGRIGGRYGDNSAQDACPERKNEFPAVLQQNKCILA
ncbi:hypothetical protein D3C75_259560 [compost metagenome]